MPSSSNSKPSPALNNHGVHITDAISTLLNTDSLEPRALGEVLRHLRQGLTASVLAIAGDSNIDFEEKGRILACIALVNESIARAYSNYTARPTAGLPTLKR